MPNSHMSHWTHLNLRFCCREHKQSYIEEAEREKMPELPLKPPESDPHAYDVV